MRSLLTDATASRDECHHPSPLELPFLAGDSKQLDQDEHPGHKGRSDRRTHLHTLSKWRRVLMVADQTPRWTDRLVCGSLRVWQVLLHRTGPVGQIGNLSDYSNSLKNSITIALNSGAFD